MTNKPDDIKKMTIQFAPGCFDNFDGTQEELDQLMAELTEMVDSGTLLENSEPVNLAELYEESPETALRLAFEVGFFDDLKEDFDEALGEELTFEAIRELMLEERKSKLN